MRAGWLGECKCECKREQAEAGATSGGHSDGVLTRATLFMSKDIVHDEHAGIAITDRATLSLSFKSPLSACPADSQLPSARSASHRQSSIIRCSPWHAVVGFRPLLHAQLAAGPSTPPTASQAASCTSSAASVRPPPTPLTAFHTTLSNSEHRL